MKFTLITPKGRVYTFFLLATAQIFEQAYGGTLISDQIYADAYAELLVDA